MDIITLTTEVKETIDLDQMSSEDLKKVVKHLWHEVQSLSSKIGTECWRRTPMSGGITYQRNSLSNVTPT